MYDAGYEADEYPQYMVIYDTVRSMCEEQRNIINEGVDLTVLSSVLGALPHLTEVRLLEEDWHVSAMTMAEKSYEHHVRVVSHAIQSARNSCISRHTISLLGFDLPYYDPWDIPDLRSLSECLRQLLDCIQILRLTVSNSALKLLSLCTLNLHQLDMCRLVVDYTTLKDFLQRLQIGPEDTQIKQRRYSVLPRSTPVFTADAVGKSDSMLFYAIRFSQRTSSFRSIPRFLFSPFLTPPLEKSL